MHPNPRECVLVELMENCFVRVHNRHMWIRILIEREQLTLSGLAREQLAGCVSFQKKKTFVLKIHCIEVANETSFQLEWIIKCLGEWKHNWALIRSNQYSINQIKKQSWFMHGKVSSREREREWQNNCFRLSWKLWANESFECVITFTVTDVWSYEWLTKAPFLDSFSSYDKCPFALRSKKNVRIFIKINTSSSSINISIYL